MPRRSAATSTSATSAATSGEVPTDWSSASVQALSALTGRTTPTGGSLDSGIFALGPRGGMWEVAAVGIARRRSGSGRTILPNRALPTVVVGTSPITTVTAAGPLGYYPSPQDIGPLTVLMTPLANSTRSASIGRAARCSGLGGLFTERRSTYLVVTDAAPRSWQVDNRGEVFLHERTHGVAAWARARLSRPDSTGGRGRRRSIRLREEPGTRLVHLLLASL